MDPSFELEDMYCAQDEMPPEPYVVELALSMQRGGKTIQQPGIYPGISRADYDEIPALNKSTLWRFAQDPEDFVLGIRIAKSWPAPKTDSAAMRWGRLYEWLLLTPDTFPEQYKVLTVRLKENFLWRANWRQKAEKARRTRRFSKRLPEYLKWEHDHLEAGWEIVTREEERTARTAVTIARATPLVEQTLAHGQAGVALVWLDEATGMLLKGLVDWVPSGIPALIDIKTAFDKSERGFRRAVRDFGYYVQNAWYLAGWNALNPEDQRDAWGWIVTSNKRPWRSTTYLAPYSDIDAGAQWMRRWLPLWQEWQDAGALPEELQTTEWKALP